MGRFKKMLDKDFELQLDKWAIQMQNELKLEDEQLQVQTHINEILDEANRWGMRQEVYDSAQQNIEEGSSLDIITAYNLAFSEWIK